MQRDWNEAIEKATREARCRVCFAMPVQIAHLAGRRYDEIVRTRTGKKKAVVKADETMPLCERHHRAYDAHELDLTPYVTPAERSAVERLLGAERAQIRLSGRRPL